MGQPRRGGRRLAQAHLGDPHGESTRSSCYDRPNGDDQITDATLQFSDGSSLTTGTLPNDGSALTLSFPPRTITSVQLDVTSVNVDTVNVGLSEIQV